LTTKLIKEYLSFNINIPTFQHSIIPLFHVPGINIKPQKIHLISISFRISETYNYLRVSARPGAIALENSQVPESQPALVRRDVDMQLFSLLMNASLCITASCHTRSGPGVWARAKICVLINVKKVNTYNSAIGHVQDKDNLN